MIYLIVLVVLGGITYASIYLDRKDGDGGGLAAFSVTCVLIWILIPIPSAYYHYHDLGRVKAQHYAITVQEERIANLKKNLNEITVDVDAEILLNADSPIKSMVDQLAEAEKSLASSKTTLANAKISIVQREIGFFKFVTKLF
jgi:hypothetical protein